MYKSVSMEREFINKLYSKHQETRNIPAPSMVCKVLNGLLQLLFPELADQRFASLREFEQAYQSLRLELHEVLRTLGDTLPGSPEQIEEAFMGRLPFIHELLNKDADAIFLGDPAAVSKIEVIRTYPGFFAVAVYRLAHEFFNLNVPLIPRILTEHAHGLSGIDIHPAAKIGESFCIDHGTGVVIGETVEIGNFVKLYQGVTLGALSVKKDMAKMKRHPTIEDRVIIYSGATILGGGTVIGHDSIIGGSVWITKSVAPESRLYYQAIIKNQNEENASHTSDYK